MQIADKATLKPTDHNSYIEITLSYDPKVALRIEYRQIAAFLDELERSPEQNETPVISQAAFLSTATGAEVVPTPEGHPSAEPNTATLRCAIRVTPSVNKKPHAKEPAEIQPIPITLQIRFGGAEMLSGYELRDLGIPPIREMSVQVGLAPPVLIGGLCADGSLQIAEWAVGGITKSIVDNASSLVAGLQEELTGKVMQTLLHDEEVKNALVDALTSLTIPRPPAPAEGDLQPPANDKYHAFVAKLRASLGNNTSPFAQRLMRDLDDETSPLANELKKILDENASSLAQDLLKALGSKTPLMDVLRSGKLTSEQMESLVKSPTLQKLIAAAVKPTLIEEIATFVKSTIYAVFSPYNNFISRTLNGDTTSPWTAFFDAGSAPGVPVQPQTIRPPLSTSQYFLVLGTDCILDLASAAFDAVRTNPANYKHVLLLDIEQYLRSEAKTAFDFLDEYKCDGESLWTRYCTPELAQAVNTHDAYFLVHKRQQFMQDLNGATRHSATATLAWAIIVDAARLNEHLIEDMQDLAKSKGCGCSNVESMCFVGPVETLTPEAQEAFKQYVRCRWPIMVFALDPQAEQQNVAEQFSRSRELQVAVAVAVAAGNVSPSCAGNFMRRLETEIETISLNSTAVAFSHGDDAFGWRFYPRLQSPDSPGTLGAFGQTLFGGPTPDHDLRDRKLEPGIRTCNAVVIMPSFVPYVTIESRANWFGLTNPEKKELTLHDTMRISRSYQSIRQVLQPDAGGSRYRPGDVAQLSNALNQLEHRLPLQSVMVEVPYLNTLGSDELFKSGADGLGPQLRGWYGAPGIDPTGVTTLYLVGKKLSVTQTQIIAGGRSVQFKMLSRNVLQISVPPGVQPLEEPYSDLVDIQAAAPYSPSCHLLVPIIKKNRDQNRFAWAPSACAVQISFAAGTPPTVQFAAANAPPEIYVSAPTVAMPTSLPLTLTISEQQPDGQEIIWVQTSAPATPPASTGLTSTTFPSSVTVYNTTTAPASPTPTVTAHLDVRTQRYVIDVDQYGNLLSVLKAAATAKGKYQAIADKQVVRWLIRGSIAVQGGVTEGILGSMPIDVTFSQVP